MTFNSALALSLHAPPDRIKVAAMSINSTCFDWRGNTERHVQGIELSRKAGAAVAMGPELGLSSYGLKTGWHHPFARRKSLESLLELVPLTRGMVGIFGMPLEFGNGLLNVAAIAIDGKLFGFEAKSKLATGEGAHDESKYFIEYDAAQFGNVNWVALDGQRYPVGLLYLHIGGVRTIVRVCQEIWNADSPVVAEANRGLDALLIMNASHWQSGKHYASRFPIVQEPSRRFNCGVLYGNRSGWDGGPVVYDNASFAFQSGSLVAHANRFSYEDVQVTTAVFDVGRNRAAAMADPANRTILRSDADNVFPVEFHWPEQLPEPVNDQRAPWDRPDNPVLDAQECVEAECIFDIEYQRKSRTYGVFIPFSGGADSAYTVGICATSPRKVVQSIGFQGLLGRFAHVPWVRALAEAEGPFKACIEADIRTGEGAEQALRDYVRHRVHCAYMPGSTSGGETLRSAQEIADFHGVTFWVEPLADRIAMEEARQQAWLKRPYDKTSKADKILRGNIPARLRGEIAWNYAGLERRHVISCGNMSEGHTNYSTIHGADDAGVITLVHDYKTSILERQALIYQGKLWSFPANPSLRLVVEELKPSAELEEGQTDEEELGSYQVRDRAAVLFWEHKVDPSRLLDFLAQEFVKLPVDYLAFCVSNVLGRYAEGMYKLWVAPMGLRHRAHDLDLHEGGKMPLANNGLREELEDIRARQAFLNANPEFLAALRASWSD
jgi:NH3-dependent NAD+ synthetase/predicted amidohydrolase